MKWLSIAAVFLSVTFLQTVEARPFHGGPGGFHGYGHGYHHGFGGYHGGYHGGYYPYHGYGYLGYGYSGYGYPGYGNYPAYGGIPYAYSSLYPYGIYHRPFPYYSYYSGAYPYIYSPYYGYRAGAYTVYSTAPQAVYPGSEVVTIYQYPAASDALEDVDKTWAWGYLAEGNFNRAGAIFAAMERQTPAAGWPKIGNGILAGFSGDHGKALYQFRRAFRFDASDPGQLPTEKDLRGKLQRLADHFKRESNNGHKPDPDAEFMVAALAYLTGDPVAAQNAIEKAMMHGDNSRSARNLRELVNDAVQQRDQELLAVEDGGF